EALSGFRRFIKNQQKNSHWAVPYQYKDLLVFGTWRGYSYFQINNAALHVDTVKSKVEYKLKDKKEQARQYNPFFLAIDLAELASWQNIHFVYRQLQDMKVPENMKGLLYFIRLMTPLGKPPTLEGREQALGTLIPYTIMSTKYWYKRRLQS
ncbi:MAG: hypothetical protein ACP5VS_14985, partial [Desulfomonilaceae bacterium]